jgi:hypothetical protein
MHNRSELQGTEYQADEMVIMTGESDEEILVTDQGGGERLLRLLKSMQRQLAGGLQQSAESRVRLRAKLDSNPNYAWMSSMVEIKRSM